MTLNLLARQTISEMPLVYTCTACVMVVLVIVFGYISIKDTITYFIKEIPMSVRYEISKVCPSVNIEKISTFDQKMSSVAPPVRALELKQVQTLCVATVR